MSVVVPAADATPTLRDFREASKADSCSTANSAAIVLGSVEVQVVLLMVRHCRIGDPRVTRGVRFGRSRPTKKAPTRMIGACDLAGVYRPCESAEGSTSSSIFRRHTVPLSN